MDYKLSRIWTTTLAASTPPDEAEPYRSKLRAAYEQFREQVAPLANDIALSVPDYTDHSVSHSDALWDTASMLIGENFPLNPAEAFVLGGTFLVHDLGMGIQAYSQGLAEISQSIEWQDLLATLHPKDYRELQQELAELGRTNSTWNSINNQNLKDSLTLFLRLQHATQASNILEHEWELSNGQKFFLIADTGLRFRYAELIGKIARSHWLDVDELPTIFPSTLGAPAGYPTDWTIDPIKIACLLRLADATQVDSRRADPLHTPHRNPQGVSRDHWIFQEHMLTPQQVDDRLVYTSASALEYKDADAWWLAYDTAKLIDSELRKVDALCADLSRPRFTASSVAGVESPQRFSQFVPTAGWKPLDARPRISNSNHVIATLGGSELYGSDAEERETPLRELLANALDATRARRAAIGSDGIRPIQVSFRSQNDKHFLSVRDFGIGMTASDLTDNLCDFGRSGWRDYAMAQKFPGIHATGFAPTGKFGIGFFSVFMLAENVSITTRSIYQSWDETTILEFRGGPQKRPLLRQAVRNARLAEPGTKVELELSQPMGSIGGLFPAASEEQLRDRSLLSDAIRALALMADEDIETGALDDTEYATSVKRNEWKTNSNEEIFDALNYGARRRMPAEEYAAHRQKFQFLSPIHNNEGEIVGRLSLNLPFRAEEEYYYYTRAFQAHCGGLRSESDGQYRGIISGFPTRAQRDRYKTDLTLREMNTWFQNQVDVITSQGTLTVEAQTAVQNAGIELGIRTPEMAIAYTQNGHVNPDQLGAFISQRDVFYLVDGLTFRLRLGEDLHLGYRTQGHKLCLLQDGHVSALHETRYFGYESPFPKREDELHERWQGRQHLADTFDPTMWWRRNYATPAGEVIRIAAEVWDIQLPSLIESITACELRNGEDNRLLLPCLGGGSGRVDGFRITNGRQENGTDGTQ